MAYVLLPRKMRSNKTIPLLSFIRMISVVVPYQKIFFSSLSQKKTLREIVTLAQLAIRLKEAL